MNQVRVEADSVNHQGDRLTTFLITFSRTVLAEAVTHRANSDSWTDDVALCARTTTPDVSKNSASSRAIPYERVIANLKADPYVPAWTGTNKGMQGAEVTADQAARATERWLRARDQMVAAAEDLHEIGIHRQDGNRLLEAWMWVTQVVTSSRWDNFFALRCHGDAHPAIRTVARMMYLARRKSTPRRLSPGEWHLPFAGGEAVTWEPPGLVRDLAELPAPLRRSVARCCWVSYENHDRDATDAAVDRTLARLTATPPVHTSPLEHQATPAADERQARYYRSNLAGYVQLRKLLPAERCDRYEPPEAEVRAWPEYEETGGD